MRTFFSSMRQAVGLMLLVVFVTAFATNMASSAESAAQKGYSVERARFQKLMTSGNFNEAYQGFSELALRPDDDPTLVGQDLNNAINCLQRLNRVSEIDALREQVIETHSDNWQLLYAAANTFLQGHHYGFMIAGKFERGPHRGGGEVVNSQERDRVRALQLMKQAMPLAEKAAIDNPSQKHPVSQFFIDLANMFMNGRGGNASWTLQALTDIETLPDYEKGYGGYRGGQTQGAPVDEEGNPIFYTVPDSFESAENDGQRWRWCLMQAAEVDPSRLPETRMMWANFLHQQFGVQTMASFGFFFGRTPVAEDDAAMKMFELHTLPENETIAKLATGIKRFELPDEFNYIKIFEQLADENSSYSSQAYSQLGQLFENRRQYPKAADVYRDALQSRNPQGYKDSWQRQLDQIVGNWGRFEPNMSQPAGEGAKIEYRFRNGDSVTLTAHRIDVEHLLSDVKAYIKSKPKQLDWQKMQIDNIGYQLVNGDQKKYLKEQVAQWTLQLDPRENHFDSRETITTPLQKAGAYLLEAKMADGNTNWVVVWLNDTAIVQKPLSEANYYFVADAVNGTPIAKANVEFFGWRQQYTGRGQDYKIDVLNFAEYTGLAGDVVTNQQRQPREYQWLVTARTNEGRFAYHGFSGVWYRRIHDAEYNATKVFTITDRPVYRPDQKVHYKFWVRHAQYDMPEVSQFAGQTVTIEIRDPKNDVVATQNTKLDAYGGVEGEYELPVDAPLGVYRMIARSIGDANNRVQGGGNFRVEEYKKPEFEVTVDAPSEPVALGDKVTATIKAKYLFGEPVTVGTVKYKVTRTPHDENWYPVMPWDWLYGSGYWWFAPNYDWYPGFRSWGCVRPMPMWWHSPSAPPEVVMEQEVPLGEDGTVEVDIDTELAKLMHPGQDQKYTITAEVVDQSRRTIVGSGKVLVADEPFKVYAWTTRGYYRTGDTIDARFNARTVDGKPVEGTGVVKLYRVTFNQDKNEPIETPVFEAELSPDAEGQISQQIKAARPGQYRVTCDLTDKSGHTIQGGYFFTVIGNSPAETVDYRYNAIELITAQPQYNPGDKVALKINTNRRDSTVLVFLRPSNGVYLPPKVVKLTGKSGLLEFDIVQKDMPNFFIEAVTIAGGKVHSDTREICVPPEKRILNVDIEPSSETYKPGERAKVLVKLTDQQGKPFVGSTVISIYDKAVEYISGGSNVGDIKEFFWKWRRQHNPNTQSNLERYMGVVVKSGDHQMGNLGVFGESVADDMNAIEFDGLDPMPGMMGGGFGGNFGGGGAPRTLMMARGAMAKSDAMPMMAANSVMEGAPMMEMADHAAPMESEMLGEDKASGAAGGGPLVEATVRENFADTALWVGAITTEANGTAEVELDMPENLTTWMIKVWGMGAGTRVGQGSTSVITRKDLILRMQTPRYFVQTDQVVLSAIVHNYLDTEKRAKVSLEWDGDCLALLSDVILGKRAVVDQSTSPREIVIPSGGEARVDWHVAVMQPGEVKVRMKALTDEESDAMQMELPCYIHGMLKQEAVSGAIRPEDTVGRMTFTVPAERQPADSRLEVRYSPTLAGAMVDALPYLLDYPYGCTEQTLNRFLPAVMTQKVLLDMGLDLEAIRKVQTNLNAQELGTHEERAAQWQRYKENPVFDQAEMQKIVKDGIDRLTEMQCSDGGWGWFSGYGEHSGPHTTAQVVHGLQMAQANDVALVPGVLDRGVAWLDRYQQEQVNLLKIGDLPAEQRKGKRYKTQADNTDAYVYRVLVDAGIVNAEMDDYLWRDRTKLAVYSVALYGLALEKQASIADSSGTRIAATKRLDIVVRNVWQYVQQDDENQTAWLNLPGGYWWCWYGSEYETQSAFLQLLCRTELKGPVKKDKPLASRLVKYLLNNRKHATYWNSTRDTALCVEAMAEYLKASGEMRPDMTVEVWMDGKLQKAVEITPKTLFGFDNAFVLEGDQVTTGEHVVELKKKGTGPLYFNGYLTNFTLENQIKAAGLEIKVNRKYYKLTEVEDATAMVAGGRGQVINQKIEKFERTELTDLSTLTSGDLVEVELEIESKNDYESLVFEDFKPAGFEATEVRSGYNGNAMGAYVEFRDNRVCFFVKRLARGRHSVSYRLRAEIPGQFSALPTKGWAMYAPELKANSDEFKVQVIDK